jgi:hypothetical protein
MGTSGAHEKWDSERVMTVNSEIFIWRHTKMSSTMIRYYYQRNNN